MRTQQERDEQTLDIVAAVFGAALLWGLPVLVLAVLVAATNVDVDVPAAAESIFAVLIGALYAATVVVVLRRRTR
ncbi:hypothetical protein [Nocardioides sp. T2.26MG-1]|uniref:hypothetical protein n=1 Tax=Nocardioides sp. T2.26MG-1 TaxID=3041166 RepID=UPI0024778820|nr:hypothetical protein [Nocardioides sp. T2.26MG-1]CAI9401316.1 hypothetical protein HIDPHFAB_00584 [Nocardioides sp. T2.26MG-1]